MITFESDLLYVRAATEFPATGVVLVTTYPLFLQNQVWTGYGSSEDRVQFVSMGSEGTYNAFRSILMDSAGGVPAGRRPAARLPGALRAPHAETARVAHRDHAQRLLAACRARR